MGCDIHTYAERKVGDSYELIADLRPFDWRSYGMYGFLAGVRNYSDVPALAADRGIPPDASASVRKAHHGGYHSESWVDVLELTRFDYDQPVEDRRVTVQLAENMWNGGGTAKPGGGEMTTYREFLGEAYFNDLARLVAAGADRVVFWFDN
jgi:hypothetical protein